MPQFQNPPELEDIKLKHENLMLIKFGYNHTYVVPYADGIKIVEHFKFAELYDDDSFNNPKIRPLIRTPEWKPFSHQQYAECKTKTLLEEQIDE